ncbi:MAG: hypothetical protein HQL28_07005, partial [Candidatus Omnitrophica bacterium]|nr:hypothetical protein [Candidatus Omnitrophota bacterium]
MFTTKYVRKIADVPKEAWESVYPGELETYDYFRSLDESHFEQFDFYYVMVHEGERLVGAAPCFLMKYPLDTSVGGALRRFTNSVKERFPDIFSLKALVSGIPMGNGQIGLSGDKVEVLKAIQTAMEEIARKEKAAIIAFKDLDETYSALFAPLLKEGFVKIDSLPSAEMDIPFKNFEEYLKTLSSASRYDLRRKFKKVDGYVKIDLEITSVPSDEAFKEMYKLYLGMVDEHEMGFEIVPED